MYESLFPIREDIDSIKQIWYQTPDLKGLSDKINWLITMSIIPKIDKNSHHARMFYKKDIDSIKQIWYQTPDLKGLSDKINWLITMSIIPKIDKNSHHARMFYKKVIIVVFVPSQTSKMNFFSKQLSAVSYFCKRHHPRCLAGLCIRPSYYIKQWIHKYIYIILIYIIFFSAV